MQRVKAILYCLKFGLLPYWLYEKKCHYDCSYVEHLWINVKYAWRWMTFSEYESDVDFEMSENKNT
jgi:hypothetical protein